LSFDIPFAWIQGCRKPDCSARGSDAARRKFKYCQPGTGKEQAVLGYPPGAALNRRSNKIAIGSQAGA
jgi:hypothetical protein